MKIKVRDIQLSGKGFYSEGVFTDDNIRLLTSGVSFHEVVTPEKHFGWIVNGELRIDADLVAHSSKGMRGKSTSDRIEFPLIYDVNYNFNDFIPSELVDLPVEEAQMILDKFLKEKDGEIHVDVDSDDLGLIILSTKSNYVLVQSETSTIRVAEGDILLLNKKKDSVIQVNSNRNSINISGDKSSFEIENGKIIIDDKEFDPKAILSDVMSTISESIGRIHI